MVERDETRARDMAHRVVLGALRRLEQIVPAVGDHTLIEPRGEFLDADE
jgi:hypothetical protein